MELSVFRGLCAIAYDKAGISLGEGKMALVEARVGKRLRALGLASEREYLALLQESADDEEIIQFLDVISTNHTFFFREREHFELLRSLVEEWSRQGMQRLRIWSAASSTGEEPFSIAFTVADALGDVQVDWRVLATDISTRVLAQAGAGVFPAAKLESLSRGERMRFFDRGPGKDDYTVKPEIRARIVYRRLNLAKPPYPMRGPIDIVFCRNVMIYFDQVVRQRVVTSIESLLRPGGYLMIGHAEALSAVKTSLQIVEPSVFVRSQARQVKAEAG